jgi:DNA processing protein
MSEGLLVVEAPARSGSLITASQAMEQGRTVFAVPGPIDRPTSEGCNRLIRDGATLVSSGQDVIDDLSTGLNSLNLEFASPEHPRANHSSILDSLDDQQSKILDELEKGEQTIDTLSEAIHAPTSTVSASLLQLEMKHLIKQLPGKYFTKLI